MSGARLGSSLGKKLIMAVTGLLLLGFVCMHLAGNLLIFLGPDALNAYAEKLEHLEDLLWVARLGLLAATAAHIWSSIVLTIENRRARPSAYKRFRPEETTLAARMMAVSGLLVLAFIIYHLLHFTFRVTHPEISNLLDGHGRRDVYTMVVRSFQDPRIALAYIVAMGLLCLHLSHGIRSAVQTLGVNPEQLHPQADRISQAAAILIMAGYMSIPLAVLTGVLAPGKL